MEKIKDIPIKKSDSYPEFWCLVHSKEKVLALVPPGSKVWAGTNHTMLVGTEKELRKYAEKMFGNMTYWKRIKASLYKLMRID